MILCKFRDIFIQPPPIIVGLGGWYKIEAVRPDGRRRVLADWFPNLITDGGLNRYTSGSIISTCVVGSGNTAPQNTDTQLQTLVASTTSVLSSALGAQGSAPYYGYSQKTFRFAAGAAAGNLSEVGVGWSTTTLFSRALILDGGGNPTTITVLADEYLDVFYELRNYVPTADSTFNIQISATTHACTLRAAQATNAVWRPSETTAGSVSLSVYNGSINASVTGTPSGTAASNSQTFQAYSNNSNQRDWTSELGLSEGNLAGGIKSILSFAAGAGTTPAGGSFQTELNPVINKTSTNVLTLNGRCSWARHV